MSFAKVGVRKSTLLMGVNDFAIKLVSLTACHSKSEERFGTVCVQH